MQFEFVGQSARDPANPKAATGRLVNLFREPSMDGGNLLRAVQGMALYADTGRAFCRALGVFNNAILAVCGGAIWSVTAGNAAKIAEIEDSVETTIAVSGGIASVVSGGKYRTIDGGAIAEVVIGDSVPVGSVAYLGGYTIVSELGGRRLFWSDLADSQTFPALNVASAEITDDPVIRIIAVGELLLVFKASGFERWATTGQAGANALLRVDGAMVETGLGGFNLIAPIQAGVAFVGSDGRVHIYSGGSMSPISTPPVESVIAQSPPESVFWVTLRGHGFVCVKFRDRPAWCYDIATGEWHERAEDGAEWTASHSVKLGSTWYVGTVAGRIAALSDVRADFGSPLIRTASSRSLNAGKPVSVSLVECYPRTALDLQNTGGAPDSGAATVALHTSRDGVTFGPAKPRSVGDAGHYAQRLTWRALGQFSTVAAVQFSMASPTELPLSSNILVEFGQ